MIKNIILDFGGILTGLDKDRCICALRQIGAGRIAYYVDECRQEDLFHEIEVGNWTIEQFCDEARRKSSETGADGTVVPCLATNEQVVWAWNELITGVPVEKLRYVKSLHDSGKYRILMLSNTNMIHWEKAINDFFTVDGLTVDDYFHQIFLSCIMRKVKPDREMFEQMLCDAEIKAEESIFIDDSLRNCQGANAVGIRTIHSPNGDEWMTILPEILSE